MSRYVVYRCGKCRRVGISEIRLQINLQKKQFHCLYCQKISAYKKVTIFDIFANPNEARTLQRRITIANAEGIPMDLKMQILKMGKHYMKIEQQNAPKTESTKKISRRIQMLKALDELKDTDGLIKEDILLKEMEDRDLLFPYKDKEIDFERILNFLQEEGTLIMKGRGIYKVKIDEDELNVEKKRD